LSSARYCHPREEHLLPLHVCYGAAQRASTTIQALTITGKQASQVIW
jgi:aromatic ring-opening dioxygenase catalytic subunit (LigB family)